MVEGGATAELPDIHELWCLTSLVKTCVDAKFVALDRYEARSGKIFLNCCLTTATALQQDGTFAWVFLFRQLLRFTIHEI